VGKMLIDASITIAYKCSFCGSYKFINATPFTLLNENKYSGICRCGGSRINITKGIHKGYRITVPCINCGDNHEFFISRKNVLCGDLNVFYCPETRMYQCFLGKDKVVRKKIDTLEKELDKIIDAFGYDDYFVNTQVMFDSLNRIHDIAEQGNLYCECGNNDIELVLLSDKIHLKCKRCSGYRVIYAANNEDLMNILAKQCVMLTASYMACDTSDCWNSRYGKRPDRQSARL
jgi:hypothetical protein